MSTLPKVKKSSTQSQNRHEVSSGWGAGGADQVLPPKDEAELKLEKLLFGDNVGFLEELEAQQADGQLSTTPVSGEQKDQTGDEEDVGNLADENLFFLDRDAAVAPPYTPPHEHSKSEGEEAVAREPAWVDSDDDRLLVSLGSNPQLRKLRNVETEDVINGTEYVKRLRRQYERLHPMPKWARRVNPDNRTHPNRRRPFNGGSGSDDEGAAVYSDASDDDLSAQAPTKALADLLRNAGSLTNSTVAAQQPFQQPRKLRPEILDIQRSKDVTAKGPSSIDCLQFHPDYPLLISSGPSSTISIHRISMDQLNPNPLLTSLHVKRTPLHSTAFLPSPPHNPEYDNNNANDDLKTDSTTIYLSSRRRYIHTWSLITGQTTKISRPFTSSPHLRTTQRSTEAFRISPCGRYVGFVGSARKGGGHINVFSTTTGLQWLCSCRVDSRGGVADFAWWSDGNGFVVAGKNGECSEYDVRERRVVGRWMDDGAVGTTVITLGGGHGSSGGQRSKDQSSTTNGASLGGDRWVALGSSSGIVNVYDRTTWLDSTASTSTISGGGNSIPRSPKPTRTLTHLTTPTSHLLISPDGQLLVMASRWKRDALRLVHLPSCTVYRNWPTDKTPLGRISSVALKCPSSRSSSAAAYGGIDDSSMLLAVGNEQGAIRLWELKR